MAMDTLAQRAYAIGVGLPVPTVYDVPDGTIGVEDRANIVWNYYIKYTGPAACRVFTVGAETRVLTVAAEGRTFVVEAEDRTYKPEC